MICRRYRIPLVLVVVTILISLGIWLYIVRGLAAPSRQTGSPQVACATPANPIVVIRPNTPLTKSLLTREIKQEAFIMAAAQANLNAVEASGNALQVAQAERAYQFAKDYYNALVAQAQSTTPHHSRCTS